MSAEGPPPPAAPCGRPGRLLEPVRTRTGMASLLREGSGSACDVRLKLTKEVLTIQKQDVVCVGGSSHGAHGGAEHRVPVVISRIFRGHAADQTGMLFVGDAVLQVNGINVENATHEEVVHLLRNAGDEVTITVEYLRDAPSFLKLPLGSPGPASDHGSRACSPLFDSGLHLNGNPSSTAPSSPSSPVANEPKYEKHWIDTLSVPLSMARISRCKAGAEKLRSGAFEVLALDGVSTGILQFHTAQESTDWLRAVSANIGDLTLQTMRVANECCSPCDQVVHMGWVSERLEGTGSCHTFRPKFLALKGSSLHVFSIPPVSTLDWVQAEKTYNLCEVLFKLHKIEDEDNWVNVDSPKLHKPQRQLSHWWTFSRSQLWLSEDCWLHTDLGLGPHGFEDPQPYCFSVLVSHGQSRIFSVELGSELATWERSFQRATFMEVQRTGECHLDAEWVHPVCEPQAGLHGALYYEDSTRLLAKLSVEDSREAQSTDEKMEVATGELALKKGATQKHQQVQTPNPTKACSLQPRTRRGRLAGQKHFTRTYACSWQGETLCFTVDFALGFTCFDSKTKNVLWRFKFSQLKGSSDDGNTRVKLLFQHLDTRQIEVKEIHFADVSVWELYIFVRTWKLPENSYFTVPITIGRFGEALFCGFHHFPMSLLTLRGELSMSLPGGRAELEFPDLTAVLHCVHAFLAAKVASVDPAFLDSQSIARKVFPFNAEH